MRAPLPPGAPSHRLNAFIVLFSKDIVLQANLLPDGLINEEYIDASSFSTEVLNVLESFRALAAPVNVLGGEHTYLLVLNLGIGQPLDKVFTTNIDDIVPVV